VSGRDRRILRELAGKYREICEKDVQEERRELWRNHNSLVKTRPPVLCSWHWGSNAAAELLADEMRCESELLRPHERWLRNMIFHDTLGDDHVCEPWIVVRAAVECPEHGRWGVPQEVARDPDGHGWRRMPVLAGIEDVARLVATHHRVDEEKSRRQVSLIEDTIGDILDVAVDRSTVYGRWGGTDLSEALGALVGLEEFMVGLHDDPEFIHRLVSFMRDAVVTNIRECEEAGDWRLCNGVNMGEPYARELPDPSPSPAPAKMKDLWFFTSAQEFTLVSAEQHWDFMMQYQLSIMQEFGLVAYGCCEDLTTKFDLLRRIPNLRRIGVSPVANVRRCAEQIGRDHVLSWKPNPAMVVCGSDADYVRKCLAEGLREAGDCNVDIMLKDVTSVGGDRQRLKQWTQIARELAEET